LIKFFSKIYSHFLPKISSNSKISSPNFFFFFKIHKIPNSLIFSLTGRFLGVSGLFQVPGEVNGQLLGMSIALTTSFQTTPDGTMQVNVVNCTTVIQQSQFVLSPEGPLSTIVKTFEARFCGDLRICSKNFAN
jgi:hypothetical protein